MGDSIDAGVAVIDKVREVLGNHGYEVADEGPESVRIRHPETNLVIRAVLEDSILFCTITCAIVPSKSVTSKVMRKMLDAGNGISTSGFQLYDHADGKVVVTLNDFCKLLALGEDDRDDILSCLEFLLLDVYSARELLGDLGG